MNLIDLVIVIALLLSALSGYRRGFWLALAQYTGTLGGVLVGVYLAPDVVDWLGVMDPFARQIIAVLTVVIAASIGSSAGFALAGPLRRWLLTRRLLGALDSLGGALLSAAVTLVIVWLLAMAFVQGPSPELARALRDSRIVARLGQAAPEPPEFVGRIQQVLSRSFLPPLFIGLEPRLPDATPSPEVATTAGVQAAAASTVKVQGRGCGGISTGSGFPIGDDLVVTNAHVVTGTSGTTVATREGRSRPATVVLFDPDRDLAVLRAPGLNLAPLTVGTAGRGEAAAAIGYPGGGPLRISPAVLLQRFTARGRDIYSEGTVQREVWGISAQVRPGNSGGPLVDEDGRLIGVIFASSVSQPGQAYALTAEEIAAPLRQAATARAPINTRAFACVR